MALPQEQYDEEEDVADGETAVHAASQWQLMWWKFRKHKVAMAAGMVILSLYTVAILCEILAPYTLESRNVQYAFAPSRASRSRRASNVTLRSLCLDLSHDLRLL